MHRPSINGNNIEITPPDDEIEKYVAHVDERIAAAIAEAQEQARKDAETEHVRRMADAQSRLDALKNDSTGQPPLGGAGPRTRLPRVQASARWLGS